MKFWGKEASGVLPICINTGKILIGLRNYWVREPYTWGVFGGAIGLSDDGSKEEVLPPKENALKELEEETGFKSDIKMIKSYIFKKDDFKYTNYLGLVEKEFEPDLEYDGNLEIIKAKWISLEELLKHKNLHFGLNLLIKNSYKQISKTINILN